jgi:putative membrane protein
MNWLNVPVTIIAAYIILSFAAIGNEIENPFSYEVSDLPLELYCAQIAPDVTIISSPPPAELHEYVTHPGNKPLYPISSAGPKGWPDTGFEHINEALKTRAMISKPTMWRR